MKENTPQDRRAIAENILAYRSKKGNVKGYRWIETEEDLIAAYKQYLHDELLSRFDEPESRGAQMSADMYAELSSDMFEHDLPALRFFFRQYLTQR